MNKKQLIFFGLATELAFLEIGFIYLGSLVDQKFNLPGLGLVFGALLGLFGWIVHFLWAVKKLGEDE